MKRDDRKNLGYKPQPYTTIIPSFVSLCQYQDCVLSRIPPAHWWLILLINDFSLVIGQARMHYLAGPAPGANIVKKSSP